MKLARRVLSFPRTGVQQLLFSILILLGLHVVQVAASEAEQQSESCRLCHNPDYRLDAVPTLEGQPSEYLFRQLLAFKQQRRVNPTMQNNVADLSETEMRGIAEYFSSRPPLRGNYSVSPAKVSKGKAIAAALQCAECHKANYLSQGDIPRLAGLHPRYAANQIIAFKREKRPHPRIGPDSTISFSRAIALGQYFAQIDW